MIKAVIFDLDHTLYSKELTLEKMAPALREALGLSCPLPELVEALVGADYYLYDDDYRFQGPKGIYRELQKKVEMPEFERYLEFVDHQMGGYSTCYPFTIPVLTACREMGMRLGMLTNGKRVLQDQKIAALGIAPYFDEIVTAGDVGILKPDPEIFRRLSSSLGARPDETVYVGDNPLDDILGAKNAGMTAVWIRQERGFPDGLPKPDEEIGSIEELPALLKRLQKR